MNQPDQAWENRLAKLWSTIDDQEEREFITLIDAIAAELPENNPTGLFERAAARDSTGHPDQAVPLYRAALANGLTGERRRRAIIQMSSSLRNLGNPNEAIELLEAELNNPPDHLTGAVRSFLALALTDANREREAVSVALTALSEYLPRYNRSLARYAKALISETDD
jgi:tetratricopeptide (TPR) repeat protein